MSASSVGNVSVVRLLLDRMQQVEDEYSSTEPKTATERARVKRMTVKNFVNAQNEHGCTALHYACSKLHTAVVGVLLQTEEIDATLRDHVGNSPLHRAVVGIVTKPVADAVVCQADGDDSSEHDDMAVLELLLEHASLEIAAQNKYVANHSDRLVDLSVCIDACVLDH
jgi:ankyrin repeat protein